MVEQERSEPGLWIWAIRLASGGVHLFALIAYMAASPGHGALLVAFFCLTLGYFLAAFVHECGHAIAALACGWRIVAFVVRPFGFQLPNRNVALIPRGFNDGAGGWVSTAPGAPEAATSRRWAIILVAGPATELLFAIVALLVWAGTLPLTGGYGPLAFGLAIQALHGVLFSLLPGEQPGHSDGDQLRALRSADGRSAAEHPLGWLSFLLNANVRLRDLPEWLLAEGHLSAQADREIERFMASVEIGRVLDSPPVDPARVRPMLETYRARHGTDGWLAACDAYLAAIWEADVERAREALAQATKVGTGVELILATKAAVAAAAGEANVARAKLTEMRAALARASPFRNPTFQDIQLQIENRLQEAVRPISPARP